MSAAFQIGDHWIGTQHAPFVIAEMSGNHNQSLDRALEIVDAAAEAGAHALKLQTYTAETITLNVRGDDFEIRDQDSLWAGQNLHDLYAKAHTPWEWHEELFRHARQAGITIFSSPFDPTAVELLESLGTPAYKIASFEVVDLPLIRVVAETGKPLIISTGMANDQEIGEAVDAARSAGCTELALLHCVSGYPAPAADYNLRTLVDMRERFGCTVGLSDHTLDNTTAIASVALGAAVIEKHFTLDRAGGGPDDSFSLEPAGLEELCKGARTAWEALGRVDYGRKSSEQGNVQFRRSLYWVRDLEAGEEITSACLRSVRPGYGLPPKRLADLIGRCVARPVRASTAVREEDLQA